MVDGGDRPRTSLEPYCAGGPAHPTPTPPTHPCNVHRFTSAARPLTSPPPLTPRHRTPLHPTPHPTPPHPLHVHTCPCKRSCALPAGCSLPALAPLPLPALVPGPRRLACRPPTAWPLLRWLGWSCGLRCCALLLLPSCGRCSASSLLSDGSRAFCYLAQVGVYIRCQPRQLTSRGRLAACRLRNSG